MTARASAVGLAVVAALALAAPATPARPTAQPQAAADYRVQPRDTLIGVSRRLLVDPANWPAVARFNGLRNPDLLRPGETLRIPLALLRSETAPATVLAASGTVRRSDRADAPHAGAEVAEGATLGTGDDGNLVVRLVDGSVLRLRANSELLLRDSRRYPGVDQVRSSVQLREGRVDVQSPPTKGGQPGFRVTTPQGVLAVRGTAFRVAAQAAPQRTLGEVLEGAVAVDGHTGGGRQLEAGFGTRIESGGRVEAPVHLLPAPALQGLDTLQERPLVVFAFPALAGAASYRAQVAREAAFDLVVAEVTLAAPPLRVAGLPDGEYVLRLRARDADGLEGRDADLRFTLKARPEPPLPRQPKHRAQLRGPVDFAWAANPQARGYRWQLARDAQFASVLREQRGLNELLLQVRDLPPGHYHWRLASERSDADAGPWGDPLEFELLATPPPAPPPSSAVRDDAVSLTWTGQAGRVFELAIARDIGFTQRLVQHRLHEPAYSFAPPEPGRWYLRLRVLEADGFVGPWGSTQFVDVPDCLRGAGGSCWRAGGRPVLRAP